MAEKLLEQAKYLSNRLLSRSRHLAKWAKRTGVSCYRLYDRDIPEIPLAIDKYEDAISIFLYERPYEKDLRDEEIWLDAMKNASCAALGIEASKAFVKVRRRQKGIEQYEKIEGSKAEFVVRENGFSFIVNLSDYLDSGLFLDHRITRKLVMEDSAGKKVLNLFCYTGSFSVYAAKGGASRVVSVDMSNTYLDWAKKNAALNSLDGSLMSFERSDVLRFLETSAKERDRYGLVILDPPTFTNSKKMREDFDVNKDYRSLIGDCLSLLEPGGLLWFSTNARRFAFDGSLFPGTAIEDLSAATIPEDFRNKKAHFCFRIRKKGGA